MADRSHDTRGPEDRSSPPCLNCGNPVEERFCSHCGQDLRDLRKPLRGVARDFFSAAFDLDSRFFKSLRTLVLRPGELTRLFLSGKRMSVLPPARMYLVFSLLLFLVIRLPVPDVQGMNFYVGDQLVGREAPDPDKGNFQIQISPSSHYGEWLNDIAKKREAKFRQMDPQQLMDSLVRGFNGNLSKALILFIPLLAGLLKLLYVRTGRLYYDHVIFALHFQSFLFLLIFVVWVLSWISSYVYWGLATVPVYLFVAMRRVYGQGRLLTFTKLGGLLMFYTVLLLFTLGMTLAYVMFRI